MSTARTAFLFAAVALLAIAATSHALCDTNPPSCGVCDIQSEDWLAGTCSVYCYGTPIAEWGTINCWGPGAFDDCADLLRTYPCPEWGDGGLPPLNQNENPDEGTSSGGGAETGGCTAGMVSYQGGPCGYP